MSSGQRILLVDDDGRNTFALAAVLKARGMSCLVADTMEEAFRLLDRHDDIRLILLDMMMPVMDGYEALLVLKQEERYAGIPVIAVTAQAMKGDREKCLAAGADDYIAKPVDVDILLEMLSRYNLPG